MNRRGALMLGPAALAARTSPPRPQNAPGPPQLPAAVVPGSRNVLRARLVLVFGPAGTITGVFVYAAGTTPGAGNPPIFSATSASTDPFGNTVSPGGTAYITIGSGTGAGRYAVRLGDQSTPYSGFAALTMQNLTHPATQPPGVLGNVDPAAGAELSLQSGLGTGAAVGTGISMFDNTAGAPAISSAADLWTMNPATPGGSVKTLLRVIGSVQLDSIASPASVTGGARLWADTNGFPLFVPDNASGDTTVYQIGQRFLSTAANQTITSTTVTTITGLAATLAAGTYHVRGTIRWTQDTAAVAQKLGFSGPAASFTQIEANNQQIATASGNWEDFGSLTTLNTPAFAVSLSPLSFMFEGTFTLSAAGTFAVVAAQGTSGDNLTIQRGSRLIITPAN